MIELLNKTRFYEWLQNRPGDAVVGWRGETGCCPLAVFLRETTGRGWDVNPDYYNTVFKTSSGELESHEMPEWAWKFICHGDGSGDWATEKDQQMTAQDALWILDYYCN